MAPPTTRSRDELLQSDPVGLTQRELLLRIDARQDRHEERLRVVEDEQLVSRTERKTIRGIAVAALAVWPVVAFILINVVHV